MLFIVMGYLICILIIIKLVIRDRKSQDEMGKKNNQIRKFKEYYELMDQWMMNREQGMSTAHYFQKNGYGVIAIYGMGPLGKHLYMELKNSDVKVLYAIDKKGNSDFPELQVKRVEDTLDEVQAVVITVTTSYGEIAKQLEQKMNCSMISLEEVICES